jgi:P4 family phage/plasmid primase-like protien
MSDNMYKEDDKDHKKYNNFENHGLENKKSVTRRINYLNLQEYIEANKTVEKSGLETHQQWVGDAVSRENGIFNINFKVNDDDYEEFIKLYTKECLKNYGRMNIMEKPREIGPLVLDFDLKQTTSQRKLTSNEIMQVIECVNDTIMKYFSFNDNEILESYILMKERPFYNKKNTNYSDGFHVHYPKLYLSIEDRFLIFEESKQEIINKNLFSEVFNVLCSTDDFKNKNSSDNETEELINDYKTLDEENFDYVKNIYEQLSEKEKDEVHDSVFDSSPIKKNKWFLYGSGKNIGGKFNLYEVKYIFDYNAELIDEIPEKEELVNLLAIRWNYEVKVKPRKKSDYLNVIEYIRTKYINKNKINMNQAFLKSDKVNIQSEDIISLDDKYMKSTNVENKFNYKANENENFKKIKDEIDITKKLVKLLSANRAYNYNDWIVVGWALFNIDCTLLNEFIEFSKKASTKFKIGECEKIWKQCEDRRDINGEGNGYTIASLYHWAKEDNFAGYKNLMSEKINALLDNGNINTDFDVAYIIFTMYQYEYVCSSICKNIWWQFKDHKWSRIEEAYTLSKKMSEEVCRKFAELAADCYSQSNKESIAGYKSDLLRQKALNIGKLVERLKKSSFKQTIIKECSLLFYWENFEKEMDQNNYLVGFDDGVFDLQSGKFRNGYPDDLISKTVGYKYKNYTIDHPIIKDIEKFMKSIQPEEDMKRFVLCYCASLFEGGNKDQRFMIWTGCGSNGKGTLINLLSKTLGKYYGTVPPTFLTQKRGNSSQATPELADKYGTRLLTTQEPENTDSIHIGFMKNITGGDEIMARPLYGDPFTYVPQFKLVMACNRLPNIPEGGDGGVWRRIRVVDFGQKFVDKPNAPNEHPKDRDLPEKLPKWTQAFTWLLLNIYYPIYKKYKDIDEITPAIVFTATKKYEMDTNVYMEFINETIEFDDSESIDKSDLWGYFKHWHSTSYDGVKIPHMKKFYTYLDNNNFKIKGSIVKGIKLKAQEERKLVNDLI